MGLLSVAVISAGVMAAAAVALHILISSGLMSADAELARRCTRTAVGFLVLVLAVGLFAFLTPADRIIGPGR